jgi:predicted glycosyltransferase
MDYEYQPANHLAFRFTSRIIVPTCFPDRRLQRYGASPRKVRRYHGTKEDVYLSTFQPDPSFAMQLCVLGISSDNVLVLMRPPAHEALYHRFQNALFDQALDFLLAHENVKVLLLPRSDAQRAHYSSRTRANLIIPSHPLAGPDLIASSDLVISAGGTVNREAAALGVPVASIYVGKWAAVDEELVKEGRLTRIRDDKDIRALQIKKKAHAEPRRSLAVIDEVVQMIFE